MRWKNKKGEFMKILMLILKHVEYMDTIIHELAEAGVRGGTILDGTGMASSLADMDDLPIFGVLRHLIDNDDAKEKSKVMLFVLEDSEVIKARGIIKKIIGDINKPNTGIMFSIPVTDVEGFGE